MPSSKDRRRLEVPTYLFERLNEIAETEDRTIANVLGEVVWSGLAQYHPTFVPGRHLRRFNERARRALELAAEEARGLQHDYVGTEHLLLGILAEGENLAAQVLTSLGITIKDARAWVEERIGRGDTGPTTEIDLTPRSRNVLGLAMDETEKLGGGYVRAEHILLGVIRDSGGMGVEMLDHFAVLGVARDEVLARLGRQAPVSSASG
jgi:ATP-dependent Clp protease ATP-binding subunit ClpC